MLFRFVVFVLFLFVGRTGRLPVGGAEAAGETVVGVAEWTAGTVEVVVFFTTLGVA